MKAARCARSFPELLNDGGFDLHFTAHGRNGAIAYPLGSAVFFKMPTEEGEEESPVEQATVVSLPIGKSDASFLIELEDHTRLAVTADEIWSKEDDVGGPQFTDRNGTKHDPLHPILPLWTKVDAKTTIIHEGQRRRGFLDCTKDHMWMFVQHDNRGKPILEVPLPDLGVTCRSHVQEGTLGLGWNEDVDMAAP